MKKLINKIGIITFSLLPIVAIASVSSSSPTSDSPQFKLAQSFQTKLTKSFKNSKWIMQTKDNGNSNITNGNSGTIFEDSQGNLWSMGWGTPLQKYDYQTKKWVAETKDRKNSSGSNITNGRSGTIFEDSQGNLWSMGYVSPLQKYDYDTQKWTTQTSANSGSNITDGDEGTIFEDSRGNLWSMGYESLLQKYDYVTKRWTTQTSSNSGSNISYDGGGTIFEDSRGNLWSMGTATPLQKYDYETKKWTTETSASSGSSISDGLGGTIFEDSRGNLWSMGFKTPLQKYNYQTKRWTTETRASSGSNITDGYGGTIFEDSRGNLWSMGRGNPLQKYNYQTKKWVAETKDRKNNSGSNISNGLGGTIFEDSRGNLWSMGNGAPLQKYNYQTGKWTVQTKESSGNNITNGYKGTIFEDSRGNLWSMGNGTPLQKLTPIEETNANDQKAKDFDIEFKTRTNTDSKIAISIKGYRKYTSSLFTHLQYKKQTELIWKVVKKRTMILDAGEYEFKWVLGTEETLASEQELPDKITISIQPSDIAKVKTFLSELSSIDIKSLVNPAKLVDLVTKDEILTKIKLASGYSDLTSTQKTLITTNLITTTNDPDGTLKVTINYGRESFVFLASGFLKVASHNITKVKEFLSSVSSSDLSSLANSNKLVGIVTKAEILEQIKATSGYGKLTNAQKALITTNLITKANEPDGTLKVTINYEGEQYELNASGFLKVVDYNNNITKAKEFLSSISSSDLSSLANSTKLVGTVTKAEILEQIKATSGYGKLTNAQKALITTNLMTKANEPDGTLKVTINYEGEQYELNAAGFLKVIDDNIAKVKAFLSSVSSSDLSSLANSNKLVEVVTKTEILETIKAVSGYSDLTEDQKKLIKENLISRTEDPARTLKVTITFEGETYELSKGGFKLNLQAEANKFQDFASTDTIKSYVATLKASTKDVLSTFKRISGYQKPTNLASGITITQVIVKKALNPQTQKVVFELTIAHQGEEVKKDVNVTFKALKVIPMPSKKDSSGLSTGAIAGISLGSILGIGIISFLIFYFVRRNIK